MGIELKKFHDVEKLEFFENEKRLKVDGEEYAFSLSKISKRLSSASTTERNLFEVSTSCYGIQ